MRTTFGGNRGYIGYSISVNGYNAKNEGRFPKTEFKKVYAITDKMFASFLENDIIYKSEWHHTSMYGNRTDFYAWQNEDYREFYENNVDAIKAMIKNNEDYTSAFEAYREERENDRMNQQAIRLAESEAYNAYVAEYRKTNDRFVTPAEFVASNGVIVNTTENIAYLNGDRLSKRHGCGMRDFAFDELRRMQNEWKKGLMTFEEWKNR